MIVDRLADEPTSIRTACCRGYGDLLHRLGRFDETSVAFETVAELAGNARERALLRKRAAEAASP